MELTEGAPASGRDDGFTLSIPLEAPAQDGNPETLIVRIGDGIRRGDPRWEACRRIARAVAASPLVREAVAPGTGDGRKEPFAARPPDHASSAGRNFSERFMTSVRHNLAVIGAALEQWGIAAVEMKLDGFGDERAVQDAIYISADPSRPVPVGTDSRPVEGLQLFRRGERRQAPAAALADALAECAMSMVWNSYPCWETGDGSVGIVTFTPSGARVAMGFREASYDVVAEREFEVEARAAPLAGPAADGPTP